MTLEALYQQVILDHARRRSGEGGLEPCDAEHFERNPTCGDELTMRIRLDREAPGASPVIAALAWQGDGCSISMASASALSDLASGASVDAARQRIDAFRTMLRTRSAPPGDETERLLEDAVAFHGVAKYVMRVKCAMLAWVALEAALREAEGAPASS